MMMVNDRGARRPALTSQAGPSRLPSPSPTQGGLDMTTATLAPPAPGRPQPPPPPPPPQRGFGHAPRNARPPRRPPTRLGARRRAVAARRVDPGPGGRLPPVPGRRGPRADAAPRRHGQPLHPLV